jgi:CPA2 family monovalent cation:H+ antiporter-2
VPRCEHFAGVTLRHPPADATACPECAAAGDTWVHLRMCLQCGHVGCCDSSKNRHARRHHERSGHVLLRSVEPGENWGYCYVDDQFTRLTEKEGG